MSYISKKNSYSEFLVLFLTLFTVCSPVGAEFIADGVRVVPLTDDGKSAAVAWAFQGDLVAYIFEVSNSQKRLMIMKSDGLGAEAVTSIGNPFFVQWAFSGKKLSYEFSNTAESESQGGVYVYDVLSKKSLSVSSPYSRSALDSDDGPFWSADDRYVVYKVLSGPSQTRQLWVTDVQTGKMRRLLPQRGQGKEAHFSPFAPTRISLQIESGGNGFDIGTVSPDSRDLILLTDIGTQSVGTESPRWSPTGEWIAFGNNIDMTQTERDNDRRDCWIARPDGSEARNLTNATSPATEKQLCFDEILWSWDGRWILAEGERFDNQGNEIDTLYLIDPVNGGYFPAVTSDPQRTQELIDIETVKWSYDSTKFAFIAKRMMVKNWGPDPQEERTRWVLSLYDVRRKKVDDILVFDEELDRKKIIADMDRDELEDISWSPDGKSILLTIGAVVSKGSGIIQPDVYRVDLPERFVDVTASQHIGPPIGRTDAGVEVAATPTTEKKPAARIIGPSVDATGMVTDVVRPLHMTVEEAAGSLPAKYSQYLTVNTVRNMFLFKGPAEMLTAFREDLQRIDSPPPHILVDLLAVELSDEANRNLGLDWTYSEGHFGLFQPVGSALQRFPHTAVAGDEFDLAAGFPSGAADTLSRLAGVGQTFYQGVGTLPSEFFIRLNTLVRNGEGTILANPRTVAMSGKESLIQIRKTVNFFFQEGFDEQGRPIVKKSDISSDTVGRIIPTLLADGRIHLVVDVGVGSFTFSQDAGLPEQTTRESKTEVIVDEGQTIVIGGLRQQEMSGVITKVPILGDIPIIDIFFKREETQVKHSVLTIFITPQVMRTDNPVPDWPKVNAEDHKLCPIMEDTCKTE